jgi:F0F1-type ATP synthase assembly protein I
MSKQNIAGMTVVGAAVAGLGYAVYIFGVFTVLKWALISILLIGLVAKVISVLFGIGHFEKVTPERIKFHQARAEEDAHPLSPELGARPGRSE